MKFEPKRVLVAAAAGAILSLCVGTAWTEREAYQPPPFLSGLDPVGIAPGSPPFTLSVSGSAFFSGSVVYWNGAPRATVIVDDNALRAQIPASDVAAAGAASVTVVNPRPGERPAVSNAQVFYIAPSGTY